MNKIVKPVNANAQQEVCNVLAYLNEIAGKKVILGQHTQTMEQEELTFIYNVTNELPALCGFELLAYSPNINYRYCDRECLEEILSARGTLKKAWDWAEKHGLVTFTWHWFSPLYGKDKSFYTKNTTFNVEMAVQNGTDENKAILADLDYMAGLLKPFCDAHIPVLWRPLHECDGDWFWWGSKGAEVVKKLYRIMYGRFTNRYHLDNLIWVFNAAESSFYPGDDVVDIISIDMYPPPHCHTACKEDLQKISNFTTKEKIYAIGETGTVPDVHKIVEQGVPWTYYMTWSNDFGKTEKFSSKETLRKNYKGSDAVTLSKLPKLYG